MPISSSQSSLPPHAAANGRTASGKAGESDATGLAGLFARVASDIEAAQTDLAAESDITPVIPVGNDLVLPASDITEPMPELSALETPGDSLITTSPDTESELPDDPALPQTDAEVEPQVITAHGIPHAISVLQTLQTDKAVAGNIMPVQAQGSGPLNRLTTALQSLNKAAKPEETVTEGIRQQTPTLPETAAHRAVAQVQKSMPELPVVATGELSVTRHTAAPSQEAMLKGMTAGTVKGELLNLESSITESRPSAVAQLGAGHHVTTRSDGAPTIIKMDIPGNIQQPAWRQALAERVVMAAGQSIKQAELRLHPAELGPVNVRIETQQDRAAIQFTAMHADTREALDAALPRLREMFSQQGMDLVRADIQQQMSDRQDAPTDQSDPSDPYEFRVSGSLMPESSETLAEQVRRPGRPDSLLDLYA